MYDTEGENKWWERCPCAFWDGFECISIHRKPAFRYRCIGWHRRGVWGDPNQKINVFVHLPLHSKSCAEIAKLYADLSPMNDFMWIQAGSIHNDDWSKQSKTFTGETWSQTICHWAIQLVKSISPGLYHQEVDSSLCTWMRAETRNFEDICQTFHTTLKFATLDKMLSYKLTATTLIDLGSHPWSISHPRSKIPWIANHTNVRQRYSQILFPYRKCDRVTSYHFLRVSIRRTIWPVTAFHGNWGPNTCQRSGSSKIVILLHARLHHCGRVTSWCIWQPVCMLVGVKSCFLIHVHGLHGCGEWLVEQRRRRSVWRFLKHDKVWNNWDNLPKDELDLMNDEYPKPPC